MMKPSGGGTYAGVGIGMTKMRIECGTEARIDILNVSLWRSTIMLGPSARGVVDVGTYRLTD